MPTSKPKDNSTFTAKVRLRRAVLAAAAPNPIVLETHGGWGRIFDRTWFKAGGGLVMEKLEDKAEALAFQRPTWRVYQCDSLKALQAGAARDMRFDIVDLDPYGSPMEYLDALASTGRQWPDRWHLVVNDGLRQMVGRGGSWKTRALQRMVQRWGNNLYPVYLEVARELVCEFGDRIGYRVAGWHGYYTGAGERMTHYWAAMERVKGRPESN